MSIVCCFFISAMAENDITVFPINMHLFFLQYSKISDYNLLQSWIILGVSTTSPWMLDLCVSWSRAYLETSLRTCWIVICFINSDTTNANSTGGWRLVKAIRFTAVTCWIYCTPSTSWWPGTDPMNSSTYSSANLASVAVSNHMHRNGIIHPPLWFCCLSRFGVAS